MLPYGLDDIKAVDGDERLYRQNERCRIDLGVSAAGAYNKATDDSLEDTARRALREYCRVDIKPGFWTSEAQRSLRQKLGVELPLSFWDRDTEVFVVILPDDANFVTG